MRQLKLFFHETGIAELIHDGRQLWASDADQEMTDETGTLFLTEDDEDDVVDYLIEEKLLTEDEAGELDVYYPDDDGPGDEDEDDDDEDVEGEERHAASSA